MKRRLFTILSVLSLLLCLALCVMRWRGGSVIDAIERCSGGNLLTLRCGAGSMTLTDFPILSSPSSSPAQWGWSTMSADAWLSQQGPVHPPHWPEFEVHRTTLPSGQVIVAWELRLPYWIPVLATSLLPLLWLGRWRFRQWRTAHRTRAGLCLTCGYDLRASEERCPECGAEIPTRAETAA